MVSGFFRCIRGFGSVGRVYRSFASRKHLRLARVFGHERAMAAKKRVSAAKKTAGAKPKAEKKTPKRMGRPPKKPSERKGIAVNLRVTPAEKDFLERASRARGMSMTALILEAVTFFTENR